MNTSKNIPPINPNQDFKTQSMEKKTPSKSTERSKDFKKMTQDKEMKSKQFNDAINDDLEMESVERAPKSIYELASHKESSAQKTPKERLFVDSKRNYYTEAPRSISRGSLESKKESGKVHSPDKRTEKEGVKEPLSDEESVEKDVFDKESHFYDNEIGMIPSDDADLKDRPLPESMLAEAGKAGVTDVKNPIQDLSESKKVRVEPNLSYRSKGDSDELILNKSTKAEKPSSVQTVRADFTVSQNQDLSTVGTQFTTATATPEMARTNMAGTIQQLVDQIVTITNAGQTDTVITLKNPPILEGATIKISSFESARGEINISFANLKPEAKILLDQQLLRNSLTEQLAEKKIIVHQIITTTQVENLIPTQAKPLDRERQQQDQQGQQGRDQQQKREQREEKEES
jgi:hypothetical protein